MMNARFIINAVKNMTNRNNEISEENFLELIDGLEETEVQEVIDILTDNGITVAENAVSDMYVDYKGLTKLTNEELCVLYQNGSDEALEALCHKNERLVHNIANKVMRGYRPEIIDEEDLFIQGNIGLIKAANMFRVELGNKFTTYACWWIKQAITREIMDNGFRMRLPVHIFEQVIFINKCRKELMNGSLEDIVNLANNKYGKNYTLAQVQNLVMYGENYLNTYSLNKVVDEDGSSEVIDFIPCSYNLEDEVAEGFVSDYVERILSNLTSRESKIIRLRYGIGTNKPMTLEEIGKVIGVTRERIRQIEAKAIRKLGRCRDVKCLEGMYAA